MKSSEKGLSTPPVMATRTVSNRSEEHTSELQSRLHLVCRLLLEKKKKIASSIDHARHRDGDRCVLSYVYKDWMSMHADCRGEPDAFPAGLQLECTSDINRVVRAE